MHGRMLTAARVAGIAVAVVLASAPAAAFAQTAPPGGSFAATDTTGPDAPLTLGTGAEAQFSGGGSSGYVIDESYPLADTGGGDVALALGGFLIVTGGGMRVYASRPRR